MDLVIAIDGPSGAGKSSVARELADKLSWVHLDTGAMYRAVTYAWLKKGKSEKGYADPSWLKTLELDFTARGIALNGIPLGEAIRTEIVTQYASLVSASPPVRGFLTAMQRDIATRRPCVMEGRDIGTVVFPNAFFKVYLTASAEERAHRRWLQKGGEKSDQSLAQVLQDQVERDHKDSTRADAPLRKAPDAVVLETDQMGREQVISWLYQEALRRLPQSER